MELVACSRHTATMNERRRFVTTDATMSPTPSGLDATYVAAASSDVNTLLVNWMRVGGFSGPPVPVVPDGTLVIYA